MHAAPVRKTRLTDSGSRLNIPATMANKSEKWPDNSPGKFYVDNACIDCDLCRETAPNFFTRNDDNGYSFVKAQPATADDIAKCEEAVEGCPVGAIGNDGDE